MNKTSAWGKTTSQCCETRGPVPGRLSNFASGISGWGAERGREAEENAS